MPHGFIPHSPDEINIMLKTIGISSSDDLFSDIPSHLRNKPDLTTLEDNGLDELSLTQAFEAYADQNLASKMASFMGGGVYHRFIPPAVNALAFRSEFYTAYTPYQPEISQGTLQVIYEFQSMMSQLTGLDVTNASVYDGANAVCESALMAARVTKRAKVAVNMNINPHYLQALQTYANANQAIEVILIDPDHSLEDQLEADKDDLAAVMIQNPDYYGCLRHLEHVAPWTVANKSLFIIIQDPFNLALLKSPGELGADIACGDIQSFGNSVNYGGPTAGYISAKKDYLRQLPGRLVSQTKDNRDQTVYTLALQTREQHIRRAKATSNICTNQALNVLKASIYLSLSGTSGLKKLALLSIERAHMLANELIHLPGITFRFPQHPFLNEFALQLPIPAEAVINVMARHHHILPGIDTGKYSNAEKNTLLVAVTEMNTPTQIKNYIAAFKDAIQQPLSSNNVTPITVAKQPLSIMNPNVCSSSQTQQELF